MTKAYLITVGRPYVETINTSPQLHNISGNTVPALLAGGVLCRYLKDLYDGEAAFLLMSSEGLHGAQGEGAWERQMAFLPNNLDEYRL